MAIITTTRMIQHCACIASASTGYKHDESCHEVKTCPKACTSLKTEAYGSRDAPGLLTSELFAMKELLGRAERSSAFRPSE